MARISTNRLGEEKLDKYSTVMKIVEYHNSVCIVVEFQDEYKFRKSTTYNCFKKNNILNPYSKTVCGVGYLGVGKFMPNKNKALYEYWHQMLIRCYNEKYKNKRPTYKGCTVSEEWHCFQNFAKWFYENWYEVNNERMHLDKDILNKNNKIYSPSTCIFVPIYINSMFTKNDKKRGEYPIGVGVRNDTNKIYTHYYKNGVRTTLSGFKSAEEAFNVYKKSKEEEIKRIANLYKNKIPLKLYNALIKYEVNINE